MAKKKVVKKAAKKAVSREYTFSSRDKSVEKKLAEPVEGNAAFQVLFNVLNSGNGNIPEGLKLQFAKSYDGHFIAKKGKNACGAFNTPNVLIVNGIADELEADGVEGIVKPTSKPYKAINLKGMDGAQLKDLSKKIANVLGFTRTKKKAVAPEVAPDEVADLA